MGATETRGLHEDLNKSTPAKLLLIGDDARLLATSRAQLAALEHDVVDVSLAALGEPQLRSKWDLALVEVSSPGACWHQPLHEIRFHIGCPLLCLLSELEYDQIPSVARLDVDDICFLPLRMDELSVRIRVLLSKAERRLGLTYPLIERRRNSAALAARTGETRDWNDSDALRIDDREKKVTVGSHTVRVSRKEYKLLVLLASDPGRVFSIEEIAASLWPNLRRSSTDVHHCVHILRKKMQMAARASDWVLNEPGFGYKIRRMSVP